MTDWQCRYLPFFGPSPSVARTCVAGSPVQSDIRRLYRSQNPGVGFGQARIYWVENVPDLLLVGYRSAEL